MRHAKLVIEILSKPTARGGLLEISSISLAIDPTALYDAIGIPRLG